MKKRISIFSIIALVICSLFIFGAKNQIAYADSVTIALEASSSYLRDNYKKENYLSNIVAGSTTGYGDYELGTENVTITADTNVGFKIVGFRLAFKESDTEIYIDSNNLTDNKKTITAEDFSVVKRDIQVEFIDANDLEPEEDQNFSQAKLTFTKIFENVQVNPVYDYIYFNAEIEDISIFKFNEEEISLGEDTIIYSSIDDENDCLNNAVLVTEKDNLFFEKIYFETSGDSTFYYTLQEKNDGSNDKIKVDILKGGYRLGASVNFDLDIDIVSYDEDLISSDYLQKQNLDITSFIINNDENRKVECVKEETSETNDFVKTIDELNRTTAISGVFQIENSVNKIESIDFNYDNYYVVNLEFEIDENLITSQDKLLSTDLEGSLIEFLTKSGNVDVSFYVSEIEKNTYFVKSDQPSIKIDVANLLYNSVDDEEFVYYELDTIGGEKTNSKNYNNINKNTTITISFKSKAYKVEFELRLLNPNGTLSVLDKENTLKFKNLQRAQKLTLSEDDALSFVGYNFVGFINKTEETLVNTGATANYLKDFTFTLSETKPSDNVILLVYEHINYDIQFVNYNQKSLLDPRNGENPIYAIKKVELLSNETSVAVLNGLLADNDKFNYNVILGQTLKILPILNDGFSLGSFTIYNQIEGENIVDNSQVLTIEITEEFIQNYVDNANTIKISIGEEFALYNFSFYINPKYDFNFQSNQIMAEIKVKKGETEYTTINVNEQTGAYEILVEGLKKYETLTLSAYGKTVNINDEEYTYIFQRLVNEGINLSGETTSEVTIGAKTVLQTDIDFLISKQTSVEVIYQMPTTMLSIGFYDDNDSKAFTINKDNLIVSQNDQELELENDEVIINPGLVSVSLKNINFGYDFSKVSLNGDIIASENITKLGETYTFVLTITADPDKIEDNIQKLVLDFKAVEYRFYITQKYSEADAGTLVNFGTTQTPTYYTILTIENQLIEFTMPQGYFVSSTNNMFEGNTMSQDNSYVGSIYRYTLQDGELIYLLASSLSSEGGEGDVSYKRVDLVFNYTLHTYQVKLNYKVLDDTKNQYLNRITFPPISLEYSVLSGSNTLAQFNVNQVENSITFIDIPYGANISISASRDDYGLNPTGWSENKNQTTLTIQAPLYGFTVLNLTENKDYNYLLNYRAYKIAVKYNSSQGQVSAKVNNKSVINIPFDISLFDEAQIYYGAKTNVGYQFKNVYLEYVYTEESWNDGLGLYVYNNGEFTKILEPQTYDNSKTYLYLVDNYENANTKDKYTIQEFNPLDFKIDVTNNYAINVYVEYKEREITLSNTTIADFMLIIGKDSTTGENIVAEPSTFATYVVYKNGQLIEDLASNKFTVNDNVKIEILLNSIELDGVTYYYKDGLTLTEIREQGNNELLKGFNKFDKYEFSFNIASLIQNVPENDQLKLNYYFQSSSKVITTTANIDAVKGQSFYKNGFGMMCSLTEYGYGIESIPSNGNATLTKEMQYLAKVKFTSELIGTYKKNFYIEGITVNGQNKTKEELADLGITILYEDLQNPNVITGLAVRYINSYTIQWIIKPTIAINADATQDNDYYFYSTYLCQVTGSDPVVITGIEQQLSVGDGSTFVNIECASELGLTLNYVDITNDKMILNSVVDAGTYKVNLMFGSQDYEWLQDIDLGFNIYFVINQKQVYLRTNSEELLKIGVKGKEYDRTPQYTKQDITDFEACIIITDGSGFNVKFLAANGHFIINYNKTQATIVSKSNGEYVEVTDCGEGYSLKLCDFTITSKNFVLKADSKDLVLENCIKITQKLISIEGLEVYDKVYDGLDSVKIKNQDNIYISGVCLGHKEGEIGFDLEKLKLTLENTTISEELKDRKVLVNSSEFLTGEKKFNYMIRELDFGITIYPDKITYPVGDDYITAYNLRGLENPDLVDLIPLNAVLKVKTISSGTNEYENIYSKIEQYLASRKEFAIGYIINLSVNNVDYNLDNQLYLEIPKVDKYLSTIYLTDNYSGEIEVTENDNYILIDLSKVNSKLNTFIFTKQRVLLKSWQIILIVVGAVVIVAGVIVAFIVIRKKRMEDFTKLDKI